MTDPIATVKAYVRSFLSESGMEPVPPKRETSGKVHLEVWTPPFKERPLGLEMGHRELINFWLVTQRVPRNLPESVKVTKKVPKGEQWTDAAGDGASSNLKAYDAFRTRPISRLEIRSVADARAVLEAFIA